MKVKSIELTLRTEETKLRILFPAEMMESVLKLGRMMLSAEMITGFGVRKCFESTPYDRWS